MRKIILIAHNLRSSHNVGSLLRTGEGLGISAIYFTGYTPHPQTTEDDRLPHLIAKQARQIQKTALGAEQTQEWEYRAVIEDVVTDLREQGYIIAALEQSVTSQPLHDYKLPEKIAFIVGREVEGLEPEVMQLVDVILQIPMFGAKESFNVVQAAAMALFYARFAPFRQ